ncbi:hypothetical protein AX777_17325 [Sphingobium yanoikuyae]|jgi:hypothetical protein|uniref:Ferritin-like domain-containing protein n=1 Tax=Sphingobium yanoikuyae TaxID=13690 RepID=A0A177JW75_SPHYA|nr:hypothetical protein [Sphingobium yanoikuyae]OAH45373.1 hypothetical protein AX777_17325 [Sphingobium yanoikuyae]
MLESEARSERPPAQLSTLVLPIPKESAARAEFPRFRCFAAAQPITAVPVHCRLTDHAAGALAMLLPILGCGEEAAGLAFADLAATYAHDPLAAQVLDRIAAEEQVHDGLIHSLSAALPSAPPQAELRRRVRRFHIELGRGDPVARLARIAALDSAVCLLLSRLLRPGTPLAADVSVSAILQRIARDEASHVRAARGLALARAGERDLCDVGAPVRERLGALLGELGDAFEALAFDPRWLRDDVGRLPNGLYRP